MLKRWFGLVVGAGLCAACGEVRFDDGAGGGSSTSMSPSTSVVANTNASSNQTSTAQTGVISATNQVSSSTGPGPLLLPPCAGFSDTFDGDELNLAWEGPTPPFELVNGTLQMRGESNLGFTIPLGQNCAAIVRWATPPPQLFRLSSVSYDNGPSGDRNSLLTVRYLADEIIYAVSDAGAPSGSLPSQGVDAFGFVHFNDWAYVVVHETQGWRVVNSALLPPLDNDFNFRITLHDETGILPPVVVADYGVLTISELDLMP